MQAPSLFLIPSPNPRETRPDPIVQTHFAPNPHPWPKTNPFEAAPETHYRNGNSSRRPTAGHEGVFGEPVSGKGIDEKERNKELNSDGEVKA
ncbi:hypothetical protein BU26DRAFT_149148 [Trematosphaeria pertusa]|uniref:Uncharacterized protein n=1 Tax=Trematosphaeria pertusa TaxID=390896 RepID=A0A6A6IXF5_9PLEO|nr:uncharacterized protein BU26DRAFT_149148 [Trematosphaeria pertusa]KAF2254988.1 hypothetical protein BU26DRAFT_149148 [Trematosphaeria pertusa]